MEALVKDDVDNTEGHLTSAAAFVEGGIQEACEDACSICLETFSDSDPSSVTNCKHEFHLQCILEWGQRSSNCPMCWQPISLKNPSSQELLEAVEQERNFRLKPSRNATILHHLSLGDFELQHMQLPIGAINSELEERIIQHLTTAAAAMGRTDQISRRDSPRNQSSSHAHPQFVLFSTPVTGHESQSSVITMNSPSVSLSSGHFVQADHSSALPSNVLETRIDNRSYIMQSPDSAGPSDVQSFPESWKSRFSAMSMRYKESLSKSTRGWKERLFSRNNSISEFGSDVRSEVNTGIEASEDNGHSIPQNSDNSSITEQQNQGNNQTHQSLRLEPLSNEATTLASSSLIN